MRDCKTYREELEELAGAQRLSLEARSHMSACASCGEFERKHDALRRLVGGLGKVEAPADFEFRLRSRLKTARGDGGKYNFLRLRLAPGLAWAAALSFLIVSGSLYFWQERRSPDVLQQANFSDEAAKAQTGIVGKNEAVGKTSAIKNEMNGQVRIEKIASNKAAGNARRLQARTLFRELARKESKRESIAGGSSVLSVGSARILRLKIPLNTSPESLRFVMTDERGNMRTVPMRAVSFGSQELLTGVGARAATIAPDKGGVW